MSGGKNITALDFFIDFDHTFIVMSHISVIIPVYNEEKNVPILHKELMEVLVGLSHTFEIVYINDGSRDKSGDILKLIAQNDERIKVILFARNFGQTAALAAGIAEAKGEILIFSDSDLQNDPHDIPRMLQKIEEGYDVVSGWRKDRKDKAISRRLPSWLANRLISAITGIHLHDFGCTLKAYRRRVIEGVHLYGEMHRFIPAYAAWYGARVTELTVNHRARIHGTSKYGINRTFKVLLDLLFVKYWASFRSKPMHFFGGMGTLLILFGVFCGILSLYFKFALHISFISTPLPLLSVFSIIAALQFILIGILAEMLTRVYYEAQSGPQMPYIVKEKINL